MALEDHTVQEHRRYAGVLEIGVYAALAVLTITFFIYLFGLVPAHVPVDELYKYWGLPVDQYLERTGTPSGWGWVRLIANGDMMNLIGVCLLAGIAPLCMIALVPLYVARRDFLYAVITLLNIAVLLLAASGLLGASH